MYVSLYRRYRPQTFSDMVGQNAAVGVLQESLKEGRLGHAYLFSGPRGCGKTSAARLVAKSLNCQHPTAEAEPCGECSSCISIALGEHLDVIEIDGASNRGIGEIRDLKSHVNLKPLSAEYKVYIIDEVHMLTEAAFNALLKTLEEPPSNVVFLLATTEPYKVPVTIRSRCQHIPFHRISIADMVKRISYVCNCENITADNEAIWEVARQADGALRDALSLTEQAVALGKGSLTLDSVRDLTGGSNRTELEKWVTKLRTDPEKSAADLHAMLARGISAERFTESLFAIFRDLWMFSLWGEGSFEALEASDAEREFLKNETGAWTPDKLRAACMLCNRLLPRARYGMRLEVFSGLIMLELMNVTEGKLAETERALTRMPAHTPAAAAPLTEARKQAHVTPPEPQSAPDLKKAFADPKPFYVPEDIISAPAPLAYDISALCSDLGEGTFSKLLSLLESRHIQIAAALIGCTLLRTDSGWDIAFNGNPHAEVFFSIPQNRKILSQAVQGFWEINSGPDETTSPAAADDPLFPQVNGTAPVAGKTLPDDGKKRQTMASDRTDRMLKLMGAEILYVKEAGFGEDPESSQGGEQ